MNRIYDMKQERAKIVAQMREIMDRYGAEEMSAEDKAIYDKAERDFDALNKRINDEERLQERERSIGEADAKTEKKQNSRMELFAKALTGNRNSIDAYHASYTLGNESQAGALTAPMEFVEQLIKGVDDEVYMRRFAHITPRIGAAESLGFPYMATQAEDAEWLGEIEDVTPDNALTFGRREFKPQRMAKLIKISKTLMNHSNLAVPAVQAEMRRAIAQTQEKAYMTGNGMGKPLGIFTASDSGIPTSRDVSEDNTSSNVTFDGLMNAKYSLKQAHMAKARWICHRDFVKKIAKLKDGESRYIWQPSVAENVPDMLLGRPVTMSEFAPNTFNAGAYVAVLGNFDYYWICDADTLELQVLKEIYATKNQIGYLFNYFGDGAPVLGEAFARVKLGT